MVHKGGAADDRNRQEEEPGVPSVHDRSHKAIVAARTTGVDSADGSSLYARSRGTSAHVESPRAEHLERNPTLAGSN